MTEDTSVKRVLIHTIGSLGDTIVGLPCYHLIARAFPNSQRILLTNTPVHQKAPFAYAVLGNSGLVHGYIRYDCTKRAALWRKAREIRQFKPDVIVNVLGFHRSKSRLRRDALFFV
jgi:heptosyltransferase-3